MDMVESPINHTLVIFGGDVNAIKKARPSKKRLFIEKLFRKTVNIHFDVGVKAVQFYG